MALQRLSGPAARTSALGRRALAAALLSSRTPPLPRAGGGRGFSRPPRAGSDTRFRIPRPEEDILTIDDEEPGQPLGEVRQRSGRLIQARCWRRSKPYSLTSTNPEVKCRP